MRPSLGRVVLGGSMATAVLTVVDVRRLDAFPTSQPRGSRVGHVGKRLRLRAIGPHPITQAGEDADGAVRDLGLA